MITQTVSKEKAAFFQKAPRFWLLLAAMAFLFVLSPISAAQAETTGHDGTPDCGDTVLATSLFDAVDAAYATSMAAQEDTTKTTLKGQADNTPEKGYRGDFTKKYCIDLEKTIKNFYNQLRQLLTLSGLKEFILNQIKELVLMILEKVCQYIVEAIEAALELICVPLPDLNLPSLQLPGIEGQSCDGISLGDFMKIERAPPLDISGYFPKDTYSKPMSPLLSRTIGNLFPF